ncbi:MAG: GNAT family N-acetyltransferase [Bacteroidia bacterium]
MIIAQSEHRNQGWGTRILLEAESLAQTFSISNLWAIISEDNVASLRAFEKAGYEKAGHLKNWLNRRGNFFDSILVQKNLA